MNRKPINKKTRFEVFKRDSFTCQYCGRSAPDVILEIDHINPVNNGGDNNILNLITSCFDCNRGKGKRKLSDREETRLQIEQLKELNQKREQLEMVIKWKKELENFDNEQVDKINQLLKEKTGWNYSEYGKKECLKQIKEFGFEEVYESTLISINQYYDGTDDTTQKVFESIGKICYMRNLQKNNPLAFRINYLCKIGKNRFNNFNSNEMRIFLNKHFEERDFEDLKEIFSNAKNLYDIKYAVEGYYGEDL